MTFVMHPPQCMLWGLAASSEMAWLCLEYFKTKYTSFCQLLLNVNDKDDDNETLENQHC